MTTTEPATTIAGVVTTLSALEQGHARQVGALQAELAAVAAQRWRVRPSAPLAWSPWMPQPGAVRPPRSQEEATMERHAGMAMTRRAGSALSGTDAWSREARRVRERATRLGLALDEEDLALQDVHDLQALHASLHGPWTGPTGTRWIWMGLRGLWARVRVRATGAAAPRAPRLMPPHGSTTLGTGTLSGGTVTFNTSRLSAGSHSLTAVYGGDATDTGSTSAALTQQVTAAPLTITARDQSTTYGAISFDTSTNSMSFSGFVNGEGSGVLGTGVTITSTATASSGVGTYTLMPSGAVDANYRISYLPGTLTVNPANTSTSAVNATATYGDSSVALTATVTAQSPPTAIVNEGALTFTVEASGGTVVGSPTAGTVSNGQASVSYTLPSGTAAGSYTIQAAYGTASNFNGSSSTGNLTINNATLTVTADNKGPVQYSDPLPTFTGSIVGIQNGNNITATYSTRVMATNPATATSPVGTYAIVPTLHDPNDKLANYTVTSNNGTLTVTPETAAIQYTGGTWAQLPSSGSATIPLQATVWDSAAKGYPGWGAKDGDGLSSDTPGDVGKMYVQWAIWPAGGCLSGTPSSIVGPVQITATSSGVGTAASSFAQTADGSFCVVAQVVGTAQNSPNQYYTANDAQVAGIAFYTPSGQFATGGGWIGDAGSSSGQGTFGFTARYNRSGSPKGQMVYVWRGTYGPSNTPADFIVKSNALTSLSFTQNSASSYSATLQGKCSYSIVSAVSGAPLYGEGNDTFSATVTDGDNGVSQNSGADNFALTTFQSGNTKLHPNSTTALK